MNKSTFETAFNPRQNSFGFLRLMLAQGVLISHSFALGGFGPEPLLGFTEGRTTLGTLCVIAFFVVSGFLIMRSMAVRNSPVHFLWNRFLRIFPAFWVCMLLSVAMFIPLYCYLQNIPTIEFFRVNGGSIRSYITNNFWLEMNQWGVNGLLQGIPHPTAINGSLWSLIFEWRCYIFVLFIGVFFWIRGGLALISLSCLLAYGASVVHELNPSAAAALPGWLNNKLFAYLLSYFACSSVFYLYRKHIPNSIFLFILAVFVLVASLKFGLLPFLGPLSATYAVLWLAFNLPKIFSKIDEIGDISYGLYIYAFPIQQALSAFGPQRIGLISYILLSTACTFAMAVLSYKYIEKPAMRAKNFDPTFGLGNKFRVAFNKRIASFPFGAIRTPPIK